MFDIAFTELLVIGVVALVIIGPERLPKVARTAGTWLGRLNRYVAQVKQDIDRDMQLEELRKLQAQMQESARKYEVLATETGQELKREVDQAERVMQAMAVTDGGLALEEYEKIKAEKAAAAGDAGTAEHGAEAGAGTAAAGEPATPAPAANDSAGATPADAAASVATPPDSFRSNLDDDLIADDMSPAEKKPQSTLNA